MKKRYQKVIEETDCSSLTKAPWDVKSRELAWRRGFNAGREQGCLVTKQEYKSKLESRQAQAEFTRVEMLKFIVTITDAASYTLLSYDKNL
jgi:hypothetical protein